MKSLKEFLKSAQFAFVGPIIVGTFACMAFITHIEHAQAQTTGLALSTQTTAAYDAVSALAAAGEQGLAVQAALISNLNATNSTLASTNAAQAQQIATLTQQGIDLAAQNSQLTAQLAVQINALKSYVTAIPSLEKRTTWSRQAGPSIAPNVPKDYGWTQVSSPSLSGTALEMRITGVPGIYSGWLTALNRLPIPATATKVFLDLDIYCDASVEQYAQTLEIDTEMVVAGNKYNLSSHDNYQKGGMLEISDGLAGGWVATGLAVGKYAAGAWHHVRWEYSFDRVAQSFRFVAFTVDANRFLIPATNAAQHAQPTTWGEGLTVQLQQDSNSLGGSYKTWIDNVFVRYE